MQTIGVVCNPNKPRSADVLKTLQQYAAEKGFSCVDNVDGDISAVVATADVIVSLGGDGTILNLAHHLQGKQTPVLGVNLGSLGFITDSKAEEVCAELDRVCVGTATLEKRFMLEVELYESGEEKPSSTLIALNDVVLHREGVSRYLNISLRINGDDIYSVGGDGIIVATPTGSTAYTLSAGGPIVLPTAQNLIVTPICHHSLIQKSIVLSRNDEVSLSIHTKSDRESAHVIVDGQTTQEMREGDRLRIVASDKQFLIVRNSSRNYFQVLKEKFRWLP